MEQLQETFEIIRDWCNVNAGFTALLVFVAALVFGWFSGIFRALRQRPRLDVNLSEGPNLICGYQTGEIYEGKPVERTAASMRLDVTNRGSAGTTLCEIELAYRTQTNRPGKRWVWIPETHALGDFTEIAPSGDVKVMPFLRQRSYRTGEQPNIFADVGRCLTGVVYFECQGVTGALALATGTGDVGVRVRVTDSFGAKHLASVELPRATLDDGRKYCELFGSTWERFSPLEREEAAPEGDDEV